MALMQSSAALYWTLRLVQFHLRTLPAVLVYLAAGSMSLVFGAASLFLFALWWATGKRRGKPDQAVARPDSVELSDDSEVDVDGASGAVNWWLQLHRLNAGNCRELATDAMLVVKLVSLLRLTSTDHLITCDDCSGSVAGFGR
jgi:hypothetical protein